MTTDERLAALEESQQQLWQVLRFCRPSGDAPADWWGPNFKPLPSTPAAPPPLDAATEAEISKVQADNDQIAATEEQIREDDDRDRRLRGE